MSTIGDTDTDTTIADENRGRRERARFLTRFAVGGGYGFADQLDSGGLLMEAHLGLRQQITSLFGLHVQLLTVFGPRDYVQRSEDGTVTRSELGVAVTPYVGPLGRFYVGPAAFLGYRWYTSQRPSSDGTLDSMIRSGPFFDWGPRLGVLVGAEEQVDIGGVVTTTFDNDALMNLRLLVGASYEFR